jgi:hypothetical protein
MDGFLRSKPFCTFERRSHIRISSPIGRNLRIRTKRTSLHNMRLAERHRGCIQLLWNHAFLNPLDKIVKWTIRIGTDLAICQLVFHLARTHLIVRLQRSDQHPGPQNIDRSLWRSDRARELCHNSSQCRWGISKGLQDHAYLKLVGTRYPNFHTHQVIIFPPAARNSERSGSSVLIIEVYCCCD